MCSTNQSQEQSSHYHQAHYPIFIFFMLIFIQSACHTYSHAHSFAHQQVSILSQQGNLLPRFLHHQRHYVQARYGDAYKIRIHNPSDHRVEAVVTVDGRDVINGKVGAYHHRGYIIDAGSYIDIKGFRKSIYEIATFRFTHIYDSYAARRGNANHVGVIGVALFAEKHVSHSSHHHIAQSDQDFPVWNESLRHPQRSRAKKAKPSHKHSHDASPSNSDSYGHGSASPQMKSSRARRLSKPNRQLGTKYGESQSNHAIKVPFVRAHSSPNQVIDIYYDSRNGLLRRGINVHAHKHTHKHTHKHPQSFPQNSEFAPAP